MKKINFSKLNWLSLKPIVLSLAAVGCVILSAQASSPSQLDAKTQQAMVDAINDEYHARAFYNAVIDQFGSIRPFSQIVQAEDRHVQLWTQLFTQYGLTILEDPFAGDSATKVEVPSDFQAACQRGVEAEIANVQMYDNFLSFVQESDLKAAFTQLRDVSQNHHKPAFERCATNLPTNEQGQPDRGRQSRYRHGNLNIALATKESALWGAKRALQRGF